MTKQEMFRLMRVISALESILIYDLNNKSRVPDYLLEDITSCVEILEREILK